MFVVYGVDSTSVNQPASSSVLSHSRRSISGSLSSTSVDVTSGVTSVSVPGHNESATHTGSSTLLSAANSIREQVSLSITNSSGLDKIAGLKLFGA